MIWAVRTCVWLKWVTWGLRTATRCIVVAPELAAVKMVADESDTVLEDAFDAFQNGKSEILGT